MCVCCFLFCVFLCLSEPESLCVAVSVCVRACLLLLSDSHLFPVHVFRRTALHIAACDNQLLAAKLLLFAGASAQVKDRWGNTPLDEARKAGFVSMVDMLERHKAGSLPTVPSDRGSAGSALSKAPSLGKIGKSMSFNVGAAPAPAGAARGVRFG